MSHIGWIAVDLDGTLAFYDHWRGPDHVGEPIMPMVERVRKWLAEGRDVRIFTARVGGTSEEREAAIPAICRFSVDQFGHPLPITCQKDYGMIELWDDRCVQVIPNTGRTIADELESERSARSGKAAGSD